MSILFRVLTILCIVAGLSPHAYSAQAGQGIVVVRSSDLKPYDQALAGFRSTCHTDIKKIVNLEAEPAVISAIRREKPALVLAVGVDALERVRELSDIPIVFLMVVNPKGTEERENITGVTMNVAPEKHLAAIQKILPGARRVGVLYDPAKTSSYVKRGIAAARSLGMEIVAREVRNSGDIPAALSAMKDSIDVFWMIPDTTVVTRETAEYILLFSHRTGIPVQAIAERYVGMGALSAVTFDATAHGRQAGEMARKVLAGASPAELPRIDSSSTSLIINLKVAKKLGIPLSGDILRTVRVIP